MSLISSSIGLGWADYSDYSRKDIIVSSMCGGVGCNICMNVCLVAAIYMYIIFMYESLKYATNL